MVKAEKSWDVIVVGGGPSGMLAAGRAAERGRRVLLLEKNDSLGDKLKITGGGRCNITNAEENKERFFRNYGQARDFLYSPFAQFGVRDTFAFFESRGCPLVTEARSRVFPASQKAVDVFRVLEKYLRDNKVVVKTGASVTRIITGRDRIVGVATRNNTYESDSLILATGGVSHRETGSTGDGFRWLEKIGHSVKTPTPDIVPLAVADKWVKTLSGASLSFMKITFYLDGQKKFFKKGKILFTHFGLSGPLILNSARRVKDLLRAGVVTAAIDAYPDTDLGTLEKRLIKIFDKNKNKDLKNILGELMPDGLATAAPLLFTSGALLAKKVHSVTKEDRHQIASLLKALPVRITGLMGFDRAVVSDGGVNLKEIDTRTMSSKIYPNLYITGDLLDINRPSGGFSLQLCWTTGFVAGENA
jgi:predicted Rossmann fold flavoprotein